jgi:predicted lipoprotein
MFFYLLPPFHVVSLEATRQQSATTVFDAADYVDSFWQGPLLDASRQAVDAADLLAAFHHDFADTATRFGRRLGLSGNSYYLVSGQGQIVSVGNDAIAISLRDDGSADVLIELGPVFGNAIRDGSGLLDVSDFANAQEFNGLSAEINRRVEEEVIPLLEANAAVGTRVRFVGGVEVADSAGAPNSLTVVPVVVEFP